MDNILVPNQASSVDTIFSNLRRYLCSGVPGLADNFDVRYHGIYNTNTRQAIKPDVYKKLTVTYNVDMLEQPLVKESADRKMEDKINASVRDFKPGIVICIISADTDFVRVMQNVQREGVRTILLAPASRPS